MKLSHPLSRTLAGLGVLALAATGCGESLESGGDAGAAADGNADLAACEPGDESLDGAAITVASKDFDEQLILGNISKLLLEDAGASVDDQINLGGTNPNREALLSDQIDHYWEYTGTAWISFYEEADPIPDRQEQYEAVRDRDAEENGLCWLEPSPFNNTYALAYQADAADDLGNPETLEDLQALIENEPDKATLCVESEFPGRNDGLPGMEAAYGYEFPGDNVTVLDTAVVYQATADRDPCNFGEVFTTDGRVANLNLVVLDDPQNFFPLYNVSPVFQSAEFQQYGTALQELYAPVVASLDNDAITELNKRVSSDNDRPEEVARDFLVEGGFIEG